MSTSRTSQSFNTLCVPADNPKMFKTVCSQSPQRSCGQKCTGFTELGDTVEQDMNDKCDKMVKKGNCREKVCRYFFVQTTRVIPASPGSPVTEGEMQKIRQRMYAKIDRCDSNVGYLCMFLIFLFQILLDPVPNDIHWFQWCLLVHLSQC